MNLIDIEKKWQQKWKDSNLTKFNTEDLDNKYYLLEMFSYPSGAKLHLGHWWNFGLADSFGIFKKMQGYNLFHPMGFDSFGLPAENYAIKTGVHPKISTEENIATMENQLGEIGGTFNWDYKIMTHTPEYYRWSQWLFLQLYKHGYAYQKHAPVNWCTGCNTVLANEQVESGHCERCKSQVVKKDMTQWFFKITDFCEELLEGLDRIEFPEKTKLAQRNWIGKSIGAEVVFDTDIGESIKVFTSRIDTLGGVSFVVLAPENALTELLTTPEQKSAIEKYKFEASTKDEITRTSTILEKTGVFTGSYCTNPINGEKVPVFVADYVLNTYGTGAVMGVAAHDTRDYDFAKKYNLPIKQVITSIDNTSTTLPYTEYGKTVNTPGFDGLTSQEAQEQIISKLSKTNHGNKKINYKLRDWSVSRQRYWGCPIPIIHCPHCGIVPVPESDLPVKLPENIDWTPDGRSPLSKVDSYMNVKCPVCSRDAKRDPDTLDTYVCSSWYELRYPNANNNTEAINTEFTNAILPIDTYVGGMEHATGHLIYIRFIAKFLNKIGVINFDEPIKRLIHQGMILASDGTKMSKSKGNTVSPDEVVNKYGADLLRLYLMFGFNYIDGGPWSDDGISSIQKFIDRVERLINSTYEQKEVSCVYSKEEQELDYVRNNTIKHVSDDLEIFSFNTAVARTMELVNALYKYDALQSKDLHFQKEVIEDLLKLMTPSCPHFCEEMWNKIGNPFSILQQRFPICDESKLVRNEIEIVLQVNSKIIDRVVISIDESQEKVLEVAMQNEKIQHSLIGKTIIKNIYIKNSLLNIIAR